jgi:hypothetical protein
LHAGSEKQNSLTQVRCVRSNDLQVKRGSSSAGGVKFFRGFNASSIAGESTKMNLYLSGESGNSRCTGPVPLPCSPRRITPITSVPIVGSVALSGAYPDLIACFTACAICSSDKTVS